MASSSGRGARSPRASALTPAYVLHSYDWSESSLILDLFTREQGRLAVAAKGAKRPYSQLRPVLLPFQLILVALGRVPKAASGAVADGASDVQTLRTAEWAAGSAMLSGAALFSGFYMNELLMRLLARQDPHPILFDAYTQTLPGLAAGSPAAGLAHAEHQSQAALRAFELALLREVGVLPDLSLDTQTLQAVRADARYSLLPDAGVTSSRGSVDVSGELLIRLQAALEHGSLPALQQACAVGLLDLKPVLRALLHYHLGSATLKTRQVMRGVQALER